MHQVGPEKSNESVFHTEISGSLIFCVQPVGKSCLKSFAVELAEQEK